MTLPVTISGAAKTAVRLAGLALAVTLAAHPAAADDLVVKFDQSQLLQLPRPVSEIIIGNPSIADVAIQSGNMLIITGKSFGITNIIALDAERKVIQDQRLIVRRDESRVINVYKSSQRSSYNCAPQCNPQIIPGDDEKYFNSTLAVSKQKQEFSERAAEASAAQGNQQ